jgi:hypothetical protein
MMMRMIIIDRMKEDDMVGAWGDAYTILTGKPEGKRPLGRPRNRWEADNKMDPLETGWEGVDGD